MGIKVAVLIQMKEKQIDKALAERKEETNAQSVGERNKTDDELLLTVQEVAAWLRVSPAWVRAHASGHRRPVIPSIKLGAFRMFRYSAVKKWHDELSDGLKDSDRRHSRRSWE